MSQMLKMYACRIGVALVYYIEIISNSRGA
jgi:hypothetical protein